MNRVIILMPANEMVHNLVDTFLPDERRMTDEKRLIFTLGSSSVVGHSSKVSSEFLDFMNHPPQIE